MNENIEKVLAALDGFRMSDEMTYSAYSVLYDEISLLDDLLKAQKPVKPYMDFDGHDVWRCGNCGAAIFHLDHTQADEDAQNYAKFCRQCGQAVNWIDC